MSTRRPYGFTIVELLVVLAIIGVLIALLLPAMCGSREAARRSQCRNNLKTMGLAMSNYHDAHNVYPPGIVAEPWLNAENCVYTAAEGVGHASSTTSAFATIVPFLEDRDLFSTLNHRRGCATIENSSSVSIVIKQYICPTNPRGADRIKSDYFPVAVAPTDYVLSAGASALLTCASPFAEASEPSGFPPSLRQAAGVFNVNSSVSLSKIRDGAANTILVGEGASGISHGLPELGVAEPTEVNGIAKVEQAWSQGYLGTTGGVGGYGSVFAATAFDATYDEQGALIEPLSPFPMKTGRIKMLRGTTYRASLSTEAVDSNKRKPDLSSLGISISPFRSYHENVCHFLFADGSARGLTPEIDPRIYVGLSTVAGGEEIGDEGR